MLIPPVPTLREMVASCQRNADIALEKVHAFQNTLRGLGPGPEMAQALTGLARAKSDYEHWSDYRGYYAGRVAREGADTVPDVGGLERLARRRLAPVRDTRLAREPGDDDAELF